MPTFCDYSSIYMNSIVLSIVYFSRRHTTSDQFQFYLWLFLQIQMDQLSRKKSHTTSSSSSTWSTPNDSDYSSSTTSDVYHFQHSLHSTDTNFLNESLFSICCHDENVDKAWNGQNNNRIDSRSVSFRHLFLYFHDFISVKANTSTLLNLYLLYWNSWKCMIITFQWGFE